MNPPPTLPPTTVALDWSMFVVPALVAALVTAVITLTLFLVGIRRENKHRFTADKRAAYSGLIAVGGLGAGVGLGVSAFQCSGPLRKSLADLDAAVGSRSPGTRAAGAPVGPPPSAALESLPFPN